MADHNVVSVVALEIAPGKDSEFLELAGQMQGLVRRKGYGTNQLLRDGEHPMRYYDIRIWRNAEAAAQAESDRDIGMLRHSLAQYIQSTPLVDVAWAVEIGLTSAGPWQERRVQGDRRGMPLRRIQTLAFVGEDRRKELDRRIGPRRTAEPWSSDIVQAARMARERAAARFSGFKVGAAIETADGRIVTGCNVENATYGLTMCAERIAIFKAISEGHRSFVRIVVAADSSTPATPCGACRQVLWEFAGNIEVVVADLGGIKGRYPLKDLLPHPFDASTLGDD